MALESCRALAQQRPALAKDLCHCFANQATTAGRPTRSRGQNSPPVTAADRNAAGGGGAAGQQAEDLARHATSPPISTPPPGSSSSPRPQRQLPGRSGAANLGSVAVSMSRPGRFLAEACPAWLSTAGAEGPGIAEGGGAGATGSRRPLLGSARRRLRMRGGGRQRPGADAGREQSEPRPRSRRPGRSDAGA